MKNTVLIIIAIVLTLTTLFFAFQYFSIQKELKEVKQSPTTQQINERVINFLKLFVAKVLQIEGEVSFEDRIKLENDVRSLEDQAILSQWNKFVESQTEEEAQREVKNLLEILVNKIRIQ